MNAGRLRHRIAIDDATITRDEEGGVNTTWLQWAADVPAEVAPVSARELASGNQIVAQSSYRITIRQRPGIVPTMRIRHTVQGVESIYNIVGALPDADSGLTHLSIYCNKGTNNG